MPVPHIIPPLPIVSIENGCEGNSCNLNILTKSQLTGSVDISTQRYFFIALNTQYQIQNTSNYST